MLIRENLTRKRSVRIPVGTPWGYFEQFPAGTYTISFDYALLAGQPPKCFLIYSEEVVDGVPVSDSGFTIGKIPVSDSGSTRFTFVLDETEANLPLRVYSDEFRSTAVTNDVRFDNVRIVAGTQASDIWTPAHADLTPAQIETIRYGDFQELKAF